MTTTTTTTRGGGVAGVEDDNRRVGPPFLGSEDEFDLLTGYGCGFDFVRDDNYDYDYDYDYDEKPLDLDVYDDRDENGRGPCWSLTVVG